MFVDISEFTVIKIVQASIDALVEKEVIPEVSEELICTRALVTLTSALFFSFLPLIVFRRLPCFPALQRFQHSPTCYQPTCPVLPRFANCRSASATYPSR
jgi:hypothetical protein